jgi:outer membrane receptor protein involved in Fe transport
VPGAENDAQGGGVVINIVLKSEYKYGLSGTVSGGYWYTGYNNVNGSTQLNYRVCNFTAQGGFFNRRSVAFYKDKNELEYKSTGVYSLQTEEFAEDYNIPGFNLGADYKITDKQTVGANYNMFTNPGDFSNTTVTNMKFFANRNANAVDSSMNTISSHKYVYTNQMANVFYRNKLDSLGSRLDIGYSYIYYNMDDPNAIETRFLNAAGTASRANDSLFTEYIGTSNVNVVNFDLEKYFSKSLVMTAGGKYMVSKTDYNMDYRKGLTNTAPLDNLRSDKFLYDEKILAFYGTITQSFKDWSAKAGLRAEQTNYTGNSITMAQTIGRNRWDFFPSVYVQRKIGTIHSLTLSYARGISRPGFRQLNPFTTYTSPNSISEGNPDLKPYYNNNLQVEYLLKNKYSFTVGYQNSAKGIASNATNIGDTIIYKDENISNSNNVFLSVYVPVKITDWWEFNVSATLRNTNLDVRTTPAVQRSKFSQYVWAANKFHFPGKYYVEIYGVYGRNNFSGIYDQHHFAKLDMSASKNFLKDRLTARLELQDPFHLYKLGNTISTAGFTRISSREKLDWTRSIGIWLTYNFSGGKKQTNRENVDAGGNEVRWRL